MAPLNPWATPWLPPSSHAKPTATAAAISQAPAGQLSELPPEVTACVLGCVGPAPRDVLGAALVCKALKAALAAAPAHLDLSKAPTDTINTHGVKAMVASLPKSMPGLVRLSLSGLSVEDTDVLQLLQHLPRLEQLQLSSCRKLTGSLTASLYQLWAQQASHKQQQQRGTMEEAHASVLQGTNEVVHASLLQGTGVEVLISGQQTADAGAATAGAEACTSSGTGAAVAAGNACTEHGTDAVAATGARATAADASLHPATDLAAFRCTNSPACSLHALDLQRCFQFRDLAFGNVLAAAATGHMPLQALAFSHLDLSSWPRGITDSMVLQALQHQRQTACGDQRSLPEVNMSSFISSCRSGRRDGPVNAITGAADDATLAVSLFLCASAPVASGAAAADALLKVPLLSLPTSHISLLALNNCTGVTVTALWAVARVCPSLEYLMLGGSTFTRITAPAADGGHASNGSSDHAHTDSATLTIQTWAALLRQLPRLQAVDLTFFPAGMLADLQRELCSTPHSSPAVKQAVPTPQLWDFTHRHSVSQAIDALEQAAAQDKHHQQQQQQGPAGSKDRGSALAADAGLSMVLRCGVNCSNAARMSPLHVAVEFGDVDLVEGLVRLGACVDARDKGNNTPLFRAAYHGHLTVARVLLEADADAQLANAAGERPLYIAALRGHTHVVSLLLAACKQRGLPWQDAELYGDGWTPVMAAAVADHQEVCSVLLRAAGPSGGKEQAALVSAVNRYGQSVLHIAARKASPQLLRLLLSAAGPQPGLACRIMDDNGDTPFDVARKNRNRLAMDVFTRQLQSPHAVAVHS